MWVLPTRSRPSNCERFIAAWKDSQASTRVYVRLDSCDPELDALLSLTWPSEFQVVVGNRDSITLSSNEVFVKYPSEPWYGFLADDFVPQTPCWDQALIKQAGSQDISYPNDLANRKKRLPTLPCVGGDLVRAVGWFSFPHTRHYYIDTAWQFIGERLDRIHRMENVIVEHMHPANDKSDMDTVYREAKAKMSGDREAYDNWILTQGDELIARLKKLGF
jgi:hypothetical protein